MSKSLGNVVTPEEVVTTQGVDVLRLYVLSSSAPWDDLKFNWDGVKTVNRAINIFWNVYRFPLPYMILDGFEPAPGADGRWDEEAIASRLRTMASEDRWIISRINSCAALVSTAMEERQLHRATRALIQCILEDLSRWYVQLVRPRMWLEGESEAKTDAYETMYYVLRRLCGLLSPFTPHITDMMYGNIRTRADPPSIHMTDWWPGDSRMVDVNLERAMDTVRSFDEASANARQAGKRKLRWPVREVVVVSDNDEVISAIGSLSLICEDRANARAVRVVRGRFDRSGWKAEPVMKALGPAFGKNAPHVRDLLRSADAAALKSALDKGETVTLTEGGSSYQIQPGHVTFIEELPAGLFQAPMNGGTVYVDVTLTPDLEAEGYAREVIRRIQEMRRLRDLNVEDYITAVAVINDDRVASLLQGHWRDEIMDEVRAGQFTISAGSSFSISCAWELEKDWDVEGIPVLIGISKLADQPGKK